MCSEKNQKPKSTRSITAKSNTNPVGCTETNKHSNQRGSLHPISTVLIEKSHYGFFFNIIVHT